MISHSVHYGFQDVDPRFVGHFIDERLSHDELVNDASHLFIAKNGDIRHIGVGIEKVYGGKICLYIAKLVTAEGSERQGLASKTLSIAKEMFPHGLLQTQKRNPARHMYEHVLGPGTAISDNYIAFAWGKPNHEAYSFAYGLKN